jgi:hypothetical protein
MVIVLPADEKIALSMAEAACVLRPYVCVVVMSPLAAV